MDLNELRKLSTNTQENKKKELLRIVLNTYNPQEIANELINKLNIDAREEARKGNNFAFAHFNLWASSSSGRREGIWADHPDKHELGKILFSLVKECVDDNVNIELDKNSWGIGTSTWGVEWYIGVTLRW